MKNRVVVLVASAVISLFWTVLAQAQQANHVRLAVPFVRLRADQPLIRETWLSVTDSRGQLTGETLMVRSSLDGTIVDMVAIHHATYDTVLVLYKDKFYAMLERPTKPGDTGVLFPVGTHPWITDIFILCQRFVARIDLPMELPKLQPGQEAKLFPTTADQATLLAITGLQVIFELNIDPLFRMDLMPSRTRKH